MAVWSMVRPRKALLKFLGVVLALYFFVWVQQMGAGTSGEKENSPGMRRLEPPHAVFAFDVLPNTRLNCAKGAHSTPIVHCRFRTRLSTQSQTNHLLIHPGLVDL
jgi:hypothetical protein